MRSWRLRWRRTSAKHRLHRGGHAHHRAHLVIAAVAALALLLVEDRVVQREEGGAVALSSDSWVSATAAPQQYAATK